MKPLIGHMGAWAARAEQLATAELMDDPAEISSFITDFKGSISKRLNLLHDGIQALKSEGLPIDSMTPQGAIYLSAKVDLLGKQLPDGTTLQTDDDVRRLLLNKGNIAVVPFTAFGYPDNTGWVRLSVGAVTEADILEALARLRALLLELRD